MRVPSLHQFIRSHVSMPDFHCPSLKEYVIQGNPQNLPKDGQRVPQAFNASFLANAGPAMSMEIAIKTIGGVLQSKTRTSLHRWIFPEARDLVVDSPVPSVPPQMTQEHWVDGGLNAEQRVELLHSTRVLRSNIFTVGSVIHCAIPVTDTIFDQRTSWNGEDAVRIQMDASFLEINTPIGLLWRRFIKSSTVNLKLIYYFVRHRILQQILLRKDWEQFLHLEICSGSTIRTERLLRSLTPFVPSAVSWVALSDCRSLQLLFRYP